MNKNSALPHILFIAGKDPEEELGGGHSSYVRAHIYAAIKAGYTPHVFCISSKTETVESPTLGTLHRIRSPLGPLYKHCYPTGIRTRGYVTHRKTLATAVQRWLEQHPEPVIIHGFSVWAEAACPAIRKSHRKDSIYFITQQYCLQNEEYRSKFEGADAFSVWTQARFWFEYWVSRNLLNPLERGMYGKADKTLVNYACVQKMIEAEFGPLKHCEIVTYCSELAFQDPLEAPPPSLPERFSPDRPLLISISRHDPRKGLDVFLHALHELKQQGLRFNAVLIGGGELLTQNRALAHQLDLDDCVELAGFLRDIVPWLLHADLFVLPSHEEQSGSVSLLEAMQCGLCCVCSGIDGMLDDIVDEKHGIHVEPGNSHPLAEKLAELIRDPEKRKALGQGARLRFEEKFTAEHLARVLEALYGGRRV